MAEDKTKTFKPAQGKAETAAQHKTVLQSAAHNLNLVINQVESLDNPKYDALLESLDGAKNELELL